MTAAIFRFPGDTDIPHSPEMALDLAKLADLETVMVVGICKDGAFYTGTSTFEGPIGIWMLARAQHMIMSYADELEAEEDEG